METFVFGALYKPNVIVSNNFSHAFASSKVIFPALSSLCGISGVAGAVGFTIAVAVGFTVADAVGFTAADAVGFTVAVSVGFTAADAVGFTAADAVGFTVAVSVGFVVAVSVGFVVTSEDTSGDWVVTMFALSEITFTLSVYFFFLLFPFCVT